MHRTLADAQVPERPPHVLERRLVRPAWETRGAKGALHARVRGDDRPPRVALALELVERPGDRLGHLRSREASPRGSLAVLAAKDDRKGGKRDESQAADDAEGHRVDVR